MISKFLRDPIWTGVGVCVTIIFSVIAYFPSLIDSKEISLIPCCEAFRVDTTLIPPEQFELHVKGDSNPTDTIEIQYFYLMNTGNTPVVAADFSQPITVKQINPNLTTLVVRSCPNNTTTSLPQLNWIEVNKTTWQSTPALLNPDEQTCVAIYLKGTQTKSTASDFSWSTHIKGTKFTQYKSKEDYNQNHTRKFLEYFQFTVFLHGLAIYQFLILFVAIFCLTAILAADACWINRDQFTSIFKIALIAIASMSSSEILTYITSGYASLAPLHPVAPGFIVIHAVFLCWLGFKSYKRRANHISA